MNKTDIDWCDMTWNPVTGCRHDCPYCYAQKIAKRFGGHDDGKVTFTADGLPVLDGPMVRKKKNGELAVAPYPFYFEPTFHRYRLDEPGKVEEKRNVFVCSMADLFGCWVPVEWIVQVLDACLAAPQHNYLFLTKNPKRYLELDEMALLPRRDNFWYGSTVTDENVKYFYSNRHNTFLSVEPMQGPLYGSPELSMDWVIVGAETGNRKGKIIPEREWVMRLAEHCRVARVPLYMKNNLAKAGVLTRGELIQELPWALEIA